MKGYCKNGITMKTNKLACTLSGEYKRKHAPEFILKIDWKLLREQKFDLLRIQTDIEENIQYAKGSGDSDLYEDMKRWTNSIEGIISLIDSIQDYAVDALKMSEKEIFNLEEDE